MSASFDDDAWNRAVEHSRDDGNGRPHTLEPVEEDDGTWAGHMLCIDDGTPVDDPYDARGCGFTTRAAAPVLPEPSTTEAVGP